MLNKHWKLMKFGCMRLFFNENRGEKNMKFMEEKQNPLKVKKSVRLEIYWILEIIEFFCTLNWWFLSSLEFDHLVG